VDNNTKTSNYTFAADDINKFIIGSSGANLTFTIATNTSVPIATGSQIMFGRGGTGELGVTGATGVTVNSANAYFRLMSQYSGATIVKTSTDTWWLFGDLKP